MPKRYNITLTDEIAELFEAEAKKMFGDRRGAKQMFLEFVLRRYFKIPEDIER